MKEKFKTIPGHKDYQVSNLGRVKSFKHSKDGRLMKINVTGREYLGVQLYVNGKRKTCKVHRLVMLTFVGESDLQVNHKNGNKTDNRLSNLEYCTPGENLQHAYLYNLKDGLVGIKNHQSKLTEEDVKKIDCLLNEGVLTQKEISTKFNISRSVVASIKNGVSWSHVTGKKKRRYQ